MKIFLDVLVYIFIAISFVMILIYFGNLVLTYKYFKQRKKWNKKINKRVNFLVLLPCLREQNVIVNTLDYFSRISSKNCNLYILVACTKREEATNKTYGFNVTTADVVRKYISNNNEKNAAKIFVYEANDLDGGDRATQMNFAVDAFAREHRNLDIDIISAFDADSRPIEDVFDEVAIKYSEHPDVSYQQPDIYIRSANDMKDDGSSILAKSNAIYQNEWTMINEIPMLVKYGKKSGKFNGYFYFNGHGEFIPFSIWKKIRFPEYEITDGIHIGYRIGMAGYKAEILDNYCITDAPHSVRALPKQHKRWYGGCMRLLSCYKWCENNQLKPKKLMVLFGFWSQIRWAFTASLFILNLILSLLLLICFGDFIPLILILSILILYSYLLCGISLKLSPIKNKTGYFAFLLTPIAIFIKSIGPIIYLFEKIFRKKQVYEKVER